MPFQVDRIRTKINLFNQVFKHLRSRTRGNTNRRTIKCRLCGVKIHFRGYLTQVPFKHIKVKHPSILLGTCFNSIKPVEWLKLFEYVPTKQGEVHYKYIRCKCCGAKFNNLLSYQKDMLNHVKADHPSALLEVWRF